MNDINREQQRAQDLADYAKYKATYRAGESFGFRNPPLYSWGDCIGFGLICGMVAMFVGMFFELGTIAFIATAVIVAPGMKFLNESAWEDHRKKTQK